MKSGATFSPCRKYRYSLWRIWDQQLPKVAFIGLNPSTADENINDPTIRRCIAFARDWGYGTFLMYNIFAWRDTDPRGMKAQASPIGEFNDTAIKTAAACCDKIIAAWGVHGAHLNRGQQVRAMITDYLKGYPNRRHLHHLGLTKDGHPKHPLYLPKSVKPVLWV